MNQPPKDAPAPASQDERNLVNVDAAFQEADFDDKLWLWWQENRNSILTTFAILVIGVAGIELVKIFRQQAFENMQKDFLEARASTNTLENFGERHRSQPLGGLALLKVADERFEEGAFMEAERLYGEASESLAETPISARARLGQAVSALENGDVDKARIRLSQLADDPSVLSSFRAEAAFRLGIAALENDDISAANNWLSKAESLDTTESWKTQVEALRRDLPKLSGGIQEPKLDF